MSILASALAGAAQAGEQVANKYIDENLAAKREQRLMELRRTERKQAMEDEDGFRNDPTRVARDRQRRSDDLMAEGSARRAAEVAGFNDTTYQGARSAAADRDASEASRRKIKTAQDEAPELLKIETARIKAMLPMEGQRAEMLARIQAKYRDRGNAPQTIMSKLADMEKALGRPLSSEEREGLILGKQKGRDPELDRVEVTEQEMLPGGGQRTTKRIETRRPGAPQENPFADVAAALQGNRQQQGQPQKQPPARRPIMEVAQVDRWQAMDGRTLKQIAGIQGHANQAAAKAELERRAAMQPTQDEVFPGLQ